MVGSNSFIIWSLCEFFYDDMQYIDHFIGKFIYLFLDNNQGRQILLSRRFFLASFLIHWRFISIETICEIEHSINYN